MKNGRRPIFMHQCAAHSQHAIRVLSFEFPSKQHAIRNMYQHSTGERTFEESMRIATVIVTWNQTALTLDCLESLRAAGIAQDTIWLVDHGSQPGVAPQVLARFPAVHLMRSETNVGFTGGCNIGARAALATSPDAIFFLNNDALVEPETIPALGAALAADMRVAGVGPKIYY